MVSLEEPHLVCAKNNGFKWKIYFAVMVILFTVPMVAHEARGFIISYCGEECAYDYGVLRAPILIETIITPEPRIVKKVVYYGNGTCVPYARYRSGIELYGNAGTFLDRAEKNGYATGTKPVLGGIMVTAESTGHVAVVEKIEKEKVYVSEQNVKGLYKVSWRWFDLADKRILGFIY